MRRQKEGVSVQMWGGDEKKRIRMGLNKHTNTHEIRRKMEEQENASKELMSHKHTHTYTVYYTHTWNVKWNEMMRTIYPIQSCIPLVTEEGRVLSPC